MSELAWWWLRPSGVLLALTVLAWLTALARARRVAALLAGLAAVAWIAAWGAPAAAWLAAPLEARHPVPSALPEQVDGIVVLGGSVDWRASEALGQLQLGASGERMVAGAALARRYPDALLAFPGVTSGALSGEFVRDPTPTSFFAGPAFEGRRIVVLPGAGSTYEEALLALERLNPRPGETWILVTSAWHMARAWTTFRTLGWTLVPYPVDAMSAGPRWGWPALPGAAERLAELDTIVREWGAVTVYRRTGRIDESIWREGARPVP